MRDRNSTEAKKLLGVALYFLGFITIICCGVAAVVIAIQNPDMTAMRRLIEYPQPAIIALIVLCVMWFCEGLCRRKRNA